MEKQAEHKSTEIGTALERVPGYLSVREAAGIIGVSERSVYGYIEAGKLPGARIGNIIVVEAEPVYNYQRMPPGRLRVRPPSWHIPPLKNSQYLTTIRVRVRPGQSSALDQKLAEIRAARKHLLPGTTARYIGRSQLDPNEMVIILVWRSATMPAEEERVAALAALQADLAEVLAWETATEKEGQVLLHA